MAKKKKKNQEALIALLLLLALAAWWYNQNYSNTGTPGGEPNSTPEGDKCCCSDPYAYIYQLPGGQCQCMTCPEDNPNVLIKTNGVCCTSNTCYGGPE